MSNNSSPQLGIIEGFFGRSWSWQERRDYAEFLAQNNYNYYIYAPKSDTFLRKNWQSAWPKETFTELHTLREHYRAQGVDFGLGLSPHEIYLDPSRNNRAQLLRKMDELNQLQPDILCLLFDDMCGDLPQLAKIQCELMHEVAARSCAKKIIFCPTYYSFDPVVEKVFGARPQDYWTELGETLQQNIDIFWTGPKVCSEYYPVDHLQQVTQLLKRKPFLWDNYPVNDGAAKSKLLQLRAFSSSHGQLQSLTAGHAVNPMNQAWLSRIPLASLPRAYREAQNYNPEQVFIETCHEFCGAELAQLLANDIYLFQDQGLAQINTAERATLIEKYAAFPANPYAEEIIAWLNNEYQFDPACLTE